MPGVSESFLGGVQSATQSQRATEDRERQRLLQARQNAAFDALEGEHGAIAGDPGRASALQGISQSGTSFDRGIAAEDRGIGREQETNRRNALGNAARMFQAGFERTGDANQAFAAINPILQNNFGFSEQESQQIGEMFAEDPARAQDIIAGLTQPGANANRVVSTTVIRGEDGQPLRVGVRADGSTVPIGTDVGSQIAGRRASTGEGGLGVREFLADPGNQRDRERARGQGRVVGRAEGAIDAEDLPASQAQTVAVTNAFEASMARNDLVDRNIDDAIERANGITTGLIGAGLRLIPGTAANDLDSVIQTIRANVGFSEIERLRNSAAAAGSTGSGLGQVTEREIALLQAVLGDLEQSRSPEQFRDNLRQVRQQINISRQNIERAHQDFLSRQQGGAQRQAPAAQAPAQAEQPAVGEGQIIQNAAGDQMILRNGQWEPV